MNRRLSPLLRVLAAGALTFSMVGVASASEHAMVRVLHASPDAPAVDVYLDDVKVGGPHERPVRHDLRLSRHPCRRPQRQGLRDRHDHRRRHRRRT